MFTINYGSYRRSRRLLSYSDVSDEKANPTVGAGFSGIRGVFECDHLNPGSVDPGCDGLKSSQVPFKATSTDNAAGLADAG